MFRETFRGYLMKAKENEFFCMLFGWIYFASFSAELKNIEI